MAQTAYPDLVGKATGFRRVMASICIGLVAALLFTCALSWYVAYGNAALAELGTAREAMLKAQADVDKAGAPDPRPQTSGARRPGRKRSRTASRGAAAGAAGQQAPPAAQPGRSRSRDSSWRGSRTAIIAPGRAAIPAPRKSSCARRAGRTRHNVVLVEERLASWACWRPVADCQGEDIDEPDKLGVAAHAAALLSILGSAVLPFLYGLLGAGAAIIRSLSRRIRASLLSPARPAFVVPAARARRGGRRLHRPVRVAAGDGRLRDTLLGPVTLSASAISFIAGFGVEAVFQALEQLIRRIFNLPPPAAANSAEEPRGS